MWTIRVLLLLIIVAVAASAANTVSAVGPRTAEALRATDYMRTLQIADGGFPAFASGSDAGATIDASFAFVAVGIDPKTVKKQGKSPADYLAAKAGSYSTTPGGAAKLVLGLAAMRLDPNSFAGLDPLAVMETNYNAASGAYGADTFAQSLFILAEASLGRPELGAAVTHLDSLQS